MLQHVNWLNPKAIFELATWDVCVKIWVQTLQNKQSKSLFSVLDILILADAWLYLTTKQTNCCIYKWVPVYGTECQLFIQPVGRVALRDAARVGFHPLCDPEREISLTSMPSIIQWDQQPCIYNTSMHTRCTHINKVPHRDTITHITLIKE